MNLRKILVLKHRHGLILSIYINLVDAKGVVVYQGNDIIKCNLLDENTEIRLLYIGDTHALEEVKSIEKFFAFVCCKYMFPEHSRFTKSAIQKNS